MYKENLIYDVGMHTCEDTKHYLSEGFNVLAIEANPMLAEDAKNKFSKAIATGKLTILNVGIADREAVLPFYKNLRLTEWSSFDKATGSRNGTGYEILNIPCVTTESLFAKYGIPFYLKVDIENYDYLCINAIADKGEKPRYASCEATNIDLLNTLANKGYTKFKLIHQGNNFNPINLKQEKKSYFPKYQIVCNGIKLRLQKYISFKHLYGSSGPFGENTKGNWKTYDEVSNLWLSFNQHELKTPLNGVSWFDFHATY